MTIGIDARLIGETGVGRYIRNLILELGNIDSVNRYIVFLPSAAYESVSLPNVRWTKKVADVRWHTVKEQFILPWIFVRERLDILHVPYVTIPLFYPGKMVVTMHDLTNLHFYTGKATTLPRWAYELRRLGYRIILEVGLKRAVKIFAVSQTTKQELMDHFHIPDEKIIVTYEGIDAKLLAVSSKRTAAKRIIKDPYFLYVGNVYPHKNVDVLLSAFRNYEGKAKLVFVGKEDFFYKRLKQDISADPILNTRVQFLGAATDEELHTVYIQAIALVFPSLMEGFGLPALEALALGCPVICSDIPVFHEILGDVPQYFSTAEELRQELNKASKTPLRTPAFEKAAKSCVAKYTWSQTARGTLAGYFDAANSSI